MSARIFIVFFTGFLFFSLCEAIASRIHGEEVCYRQQKHSVIGYNISTQHEITVDVGECATGDALKYSNQAISKRSYDCVPYTMTEERVLLYNTFILEMEKVLTCQKVPSTCQRLPRMVTYYPGTAFARTIDVGACGGRCGDEVVCLPTRNRTTAISTPNAARSDLGNNMSARIFIVFFTGFLFFSLCEAIGKRSIEVIEDCTCVTPYCHRVSAFEAFPEQFTDAKGNKAIRTKLIDMGKCVGNDRCPVPEIEYRSYTSPWIFDIIREITCTTKTTKMQSYVAVGGRQVQVATVDTCFCN